MRLPDRRLGGLLAVAFALGCAAPPVNYYAPGAPALPPLDESHRAGLLESLATSLVESEITRVSVVEPGTRLEVHPVNGRAAELETAPLIALEAASFGAAPSSRGAEYDLLVQDPDRPPGVIVTVRHDLDGHLAVLLGGPPVALDGEAPSSDGLQRDFRIGPLVDGDATWTGGERRALAAGLALLSPDERAYLRGIPFRRDAMGLDATHAGYYHFSETAEGGEIVLVDRAFGVDGRQFVGAPERAYPYAVYVILHEMGHAVAKLDRERLVEIYRRDVARYNELVDIANEYVDPLNERYRLVGRLRNPRQQRELREDIRRLERAHRKVESVMRTGRRRLSELERMIDNPSPMEQAYGALAGAAGGPTPYGRTNVVEGFAEAFALYHLDAESVRRFSPAVHDWFAGDQHLLAALYPPLESVETPSAALGQDPAAPAAP